MARRPVRPFGDAAFLLSTHTVHEAHALAAAITAQGWIGVDDVVVGFRSVTVVADPAAVDPAGLGAALAAIDPLDHRAPAPGAGDAGHTGGRRVEIPVTFDGPDLAAVAALARTSPREVVTQLLRARLSVAFLGFLPGFAYLVGLPPALAAVPRRATPRPSVPGGSVALGGGFAGVYPQASPGGWHLLGRTDISLFDHRRAPYAVLAPGDVVRLRVEGPGARRAADRRAGASIGEHARRAPRAGAGSGARVVEVLDAGILTTVQDAGRRGVAGMGVPRAGGADPFALRVANRLVGNEDHAGVLELTARGPRLRFGCAAHVAVVGDVDLALDGGPVTAGAVVPVAPGQVLSVGTARHALRAYVAVAGGFEVEPVLGSRSSDVLTGLGHGPLRAADVLALGGPRRPRGRLVPRAEDGARRVARVVAGPDDAPGALAALTAVPWTVDRDSDRVGLRLVPPEGEAHLFPDLRAVPVDSRGMATGAVQVPPDGCPVVLLCDHATTGGYPVPATVITADLGVLGACRPGDAFRFELVDLEEARAARQARQRAVAGAVAGWYPVRSW